LSINLPAISITTADQFTLDLQGIDFESIAWIEFLIETPYTLPLQMGGVNINLPAWFDYPIEIHRQINGIWVPLNGAQAPINITPMLLPVLQSNMSSKLLVTLYQKGQVPAITTPLPLFRQGWVPNVVNNVSGTAQNFQDDGRGAGSLTGEATVFGSLVSSILLYNQGLLYLGRNASSEDGEIHVLDNNGTAFDTVIVGGLGTFPIGLRANALQATDTLNDLALQVTDAARRIRFDVNSVHTAQVVSSGFQLLAGFHFLAVNATQALANGSTITLSGSYIRVSNTANVTGIVMTAGASEGQVVFLYNQGTGVVTFAAAGSNVRQGSNVTVQSGSLLVMIYDGASWATSRYV
jgi:hypothetical protein